MAHYSSADWSRYCRGALDRNRRRRMERHLLRCDRCLNSYLELAGEEEAAAAALLLPDFEANLWRLIRRKQREAARKRKSRLLFNYIAAAVITLVLMAGGAFDAVAAGLPALLKETRHIPRLINETVAAGLPGELFHNENRAD